MPDLMNLEGLLVEDEPDLTDLLTFVLQEAGAKIIHVDTVQGALNILREQPLDFLVADLKLSDSNGYTLLKKVRAGETRLNQKIPAIALTAYTREFEKSLAIAAGFQEFLPKPVDPNELILAIHQIIESN